jgi:nitric oxide reductase NorQ protein
MNELRIEKHGNGYKAFDTVTGIENTEPRQIMMQLAYENDEILYLAGSKWRRKAASSTQVMAMRTPSAKSKGSKSDKSIVDASKQEIGVFDANEVQDEAIKFIHESPKYRPDEIIISDLKWKFLVRSIVRGKNIMVTGPAGAGKTQTAIAAAKALNRPLFRFNLGASQDPKSFLIGNTHFEKDKGTIFADSAFIKAIETENAVILMDELSRAHPDAWNILMTVLDPKQRYVRIDDDPNTPVINVAENVSFIATANIGNEYTATRIMDRALMDRFVVVEMEVLDKSGETKLLGHLFPSLPRIVLNFVTDITSSTRDEMKTQSPRISGPISTRMAIELTELLADGFSLAEAAEVAIYPQYSPEGGAESERVFIKQLVQKYCDDGSSDNLMNNAANSKVESESVVSSLPF